ncbi:hypothetical protein [uncultured Alistipes sp.]|uniref:hypothetical protein n=1 Tax=uncultured Alistipes sp. TaxID=538949 RepID=UPI0032206863
MALNMDWQDYTVGIILGGIVALLLWRFVCFVSGRCRGGCAGCGATRCPLKNRKK